MSTSIELSPAPANTQAGREQRKAPRYPTLQRCFVWPPGANGPTGLHSIVYNISTTGIGITLPLPLPVGQILRIEPFDVPGAGPIQARIVHHKPVEFLWFSGCELLQPLSEEELRAWLAFKRDWLRQESKSTFPW